MGYFNFYGFFFNLKYFLRRLPKKILVAILIFLIIIICHLKGYCTTVTNIPNTDIYQEYKTIIDADWYNLLYINLNIAKSNNGEFNSDFKRFCSVVTTRSTWYYWFVSNDKKAEFFLDSNRQPISQSPRTIMYGIASLDDITYGDSGITTVIPGSINSSATVSREWKLLSPSTVTPYISKISFSGFTPTVTGNIRGYMRVPEGFFQYCPTDIYDDIYRIGRGEFSISSIDSKVDEISQKIDTLNNEISNMNDFLQDDTTSDYSQSDLPSDNSNDVTRNWYNTFFTRIYNACTGTAQDVEITIPYMNYTFTVNSDYMSNALSDSGFYQLKNLISTIWWFVFARFILKDIYKYINQIKNGDISHTDTNIKADML